MAAETYNTDAQTHSVEARDAVLKMQTITKWEDVKPFADQIVAYNPHGSFYYGASMGSRIGDKDLKFAWIEDEPSPWEGGGLGYTMYMVYNPEDIRKTVALNTYKLRGSHIQMRFATYTEISTIIDLVSEGNARIDCTHVHGRLIRALVRSHNSYAQIFERSSDDSVARRK